MKIRPSLLLTVLIPVQVLILSCSCSKKGDIPLVIDGTSDYVIFLDDSAPESVRAAARDLKQYFQKVTGASPEIIHSGQVPSRPFISLGSTKAAASEGLDTKEVPDDGFRMVTIGRNLYILGPDTPDGTIICGARFLKKR
jgi:hypothetical protein